MNIESGLHCNTLCKHWGRGEEALLVAASLSVNIDLHTFRAKLLDLGDAHLIYQTIRLLSRGTYPRAPTLP
ncbi:hypothetical protein HBH56_128490 [Parastagonospora nodorum]|nr:hypothetical protein HBH56_128490 [Parastagonospora nodorum]KAH3947205.1 hypothetical protein HBH53_118790 [Parastagonospora nodorum]KAH3970791.1 hypothetical protein HBH51_115200 [Parastagonospora nodorum]KAH3971484.1 hypothetical protein HBH52_157460 [Parastagonospora nodorum]KAH3996504.1 hypothetical protein HBI10_156560 [Parastagonospora nodorum]